jgi:serine/threonine protein phosphatase PrpC
VACSGDVHFKHDEKEKAVMHLEGSLAVSVAQSSFAGVKAHNEDSLGIMIPRGMALGTKGVVAVIADGVSTADAGKEASEVCVKNFISDYFSTPESWSVKKSAHQVIIALNRWLYGQGQRFEFAHKGYVSTFSAIILKSNKAHIFHVGDSRAYLLRNGEFTQMTRDHVTSIGDQKRYLSRAMGLDVNLDVDYQTLALEEGDTFFLSTDGVHDFITDELIKGFIENAADISEETCNAIIAKALENDSNDNLSCQLVKVDALSGDDANTVINKLAEMPFPPDLEPGMILDGLRVEKTIHASSRSQLYVVQDVETAERYVMKTPSVNFEDDPAYIERFIMEAWVGKRVSSPHIVKVVDRGVSPSCLYHLMDYLQGITLGEWSAQHGNDDVKRILSIIKQIALALRVFHRNDIIHQDIKPDNIMVDAQGQVTVIDFGSCCVAGIEEIQQPFERDQALGTVDYSAPEYHLRQKGTQRSDQFSLAVVAYQLLTGKLPYFGKLETANSVQAMSRLSYQSAHTLNPMVPEWMDFALEKALKVNSSHRYIDVDEFIAELNSPSEYFKPSNSLSWLEKDPVRFWQVTSALLLLSQIITWVLLVD